MADNLPPPYTRKKDMTPEQLEAHKAARRKSQREWARAHKYTSYPRTKARMAADPEYAARVREKWARSNAKRRAAGAIKEETPEARERRLQRDREHKVKKYRDEKVLREIIRVEKSVAQQAETKEAAAQKPFRFSFKKKPGRIMALSGWSGF